MSKEAKDILALAFCVFFFYQAGMEPLTILGIAFGLIFLKEWEK